MTWVPGGEFTMESDAFYPEERPVREVNADDFWMDTRPATISDLRRFATAAGYQPFAERPLRAARRGDRHPVERVAYAHEGTSRASAFPANGYALFDMAGNVWQRTTDSFRLRHASPAALCSPVPRNPVAAKLSRDRVPVIPRRAPVGFRCVIRSGPLLARPGRRPACHFTSGRRGEPVLVAEFVAEVQRVLRCRQRLA